VCWRSGEPRADFVGERSIQRDRPGVLQSLGLDAPEHIAAVALLCRNRDAKQEKEKPGNNHDTTFHQIPSTAQCGCIRRRSPRSVRFSQTQTYARHQRDG
jgi:hypothetical protein